MIPNSHLLLDVMCFFSSELGGRRLRTATLSEPLDSIDYKQTASADARAEGSAALVCV